MASQVGRNSQVRVPLSIERVLEAAVRLADEGGLESLSMRKLARELDVEVMSLYYYVAKKDDILNGILELVVKEIEVASETADWKTALRCTAISAHEVLERHPWACGLMMSPARVRAGRMRFMNAMLGCLRRAGFSADMTDRAYHALDSHIIGSTLWEVGYSAGTDAAAAGTPEVPTTAAEFAAAFLQAIPAGQFPYLIEHVEQHLALPHAGETAFQFGLDLILEGLERIRAAQDSAN